MIKKIDLAKTKIILGGETLSEKPPFKGKLWDMLARQFKKLVEEKNRGQ